jgi:hypothetical protein
MAWTESHTVLLRHRKLAELATSLRIRRSHAMGHLHALWHAALEQQEDGDLSAWSEAFIAESSDYPGDPIEYVRLLQSHRWLDGRMIHDWLDYAGLYLTKKYSTSNRERLKDIWAKHGREYGVNGKRTTSERLPLAPDQPNPPDQPNLTNLTNPPAAGAAGAVSDPLDIPAVLHSPEFTAAWQRWMTFRRGLGKKPKDWSVMFSEQLEWLKQFGANEAAEMLGQSIRNGWQGLFERKTGQAGRKPESRQMDEDLEIKKLI